MLDRPPALGLTPSAHSPSRFAHSMMIIRDTRDVVDFSFMFDNATLFDQPIGAWDTSAATDVRAMFRNAASFNQPIGDWNLAKINSTFMMFSNAAAFDQPIGAWDTSAVTDMRFMLRGAVSFNQPVGDWNTSAVSTYLDRCALALRSSLFALRSSHFALRSSLLARPDSLAPHSTLNRQVTDMSLLFDTASSFNQPLDKWDTRKVHHMSYMHVVFVERAAALLMT